MISLPSDPFFLLSPKLNTRVGCLRPVPMVKPQNWNLMNNTPLTIGQIFAALNRHKFKAFFAWFLIMCAVVAMFLLWPRKFGSEGRLYVQLGRNNTALTPTTGSSAISIQDTRETEIRSVLEIIKSRAVLEAVVKDVGASTILKSRWSEYVPDISLPNFFSSSSEDENGMSLEEYNDLKERELAAKYLEKNMTVDSEKKTSVISVFVKANSARLAQSIVDKVFEHTRRVHLKVHGVEGSAVFFDDQFDAQEEELVDAIEKLAEFRNEREVLSIGSQIGTWQGILATVENGLVDSEIELETANERLAKLGELMSKTSVQIDVPKAGVERLSYEESRTEVFKLEAEQERLKATYRSSHPEVVRVENQLRKLKSSLKGMKVDRTESAKMSNPVYEDMQVDLMRAQAEKAAILGRLNSLRQKKKDVIAKAKTLNNDQIEADQLLRNVEIARQYLAIYTQKRGEAKGLSLLDDRKISEVVVAQEPNFVVKHVSPKGSLIIPLGFICGLLGAFATALFCDRNHLSASLNESEVEQVLNLPVLVTLPRVYSSRNMVN